MKKVILAALLMISVSSFAQTTKQDPVFAQADTAKHHVAVKHTTAKHDTTKHHATVKPAAIAPVKTHTVTPVKDTAKRIAGVGVHN